MRASRRSAGSARGWAGANDSRCCCARSRTARSSVSQRSPSFDGGRRFRNFWRRQIHGGANNRMHLVRRHWMDIGAATTVQALTHPVRVHSRKTIGKSGHLQTPTLQLYCTGFSICTHGAYTALKVAWTRPRHTGTASGAWHADPEMTSLPTRRLVGPTTASCVLCSLYDVTFMVERTDRDNHGVLRFAVDCKSTLLEPPGVATDALCQIAVVPFYHDMVSSNQAGNG